MLYRLMNLLKLFSCLAREHGTGRALIRAASEGFKFFATPRHETIVKLENGTRLFLIPNDRGISAELRLFKTHEPLATEVLTKNIKKGMIVVDIGSNIGYYVALESKLVGQDGIVVAVEPVPLNFSYLLKNVRINNFTNVIIVNKAISDRNSTIRMIKSKKSNWSRVLKSNEDIYSSDIDSIFQIQSVTLDTLIEQLGLKKVDIIRMDVEGYEDYIIKGAKDTIKKHLPDIFMELHCFLIGKKRLVNMLSELYNIGYDTKYIIPRKIDFSFLCRKEDIITKDITQLINYPVPDVLSVYFTTNKN